MPSGDDEAEQLRQEILPMLCGEEAWDLDANPDLTERAIDLCGRDWFNDQRARASTIAKALALELTSYAVEHKLPFDAVEGETIRLIPRGLRDDTPIILTGIGGIRELLESWVQLCLRRGEERQVWRTMYPHSHAETGDFVARLKSDLLTSRPDGW